MHSSIRFAVIAGIAVGLFASQAAEAQFNLFRDIAKGAQADTTSSKCKSGKKSRGGAIFGSVLGGAAQRTAGRTAVGSFLPVAKFSDTITDVIACKLDEKEQEQAANATTRALEQAELAEKPPVPVKPAKPVKGKPVVPVAPQPERSAGPQTIAWQSETRANVTGTSTVQGKTKLADGTSCMNVTDVIIVEGEETMVQKKMCKGPGQSRYVLTA